MLFSLFWLLGGVFTLFLGARLTIFYVRRETGEFSRESMDNVCGRGVVPRWVSFMILIAWVVTITSLLGAIGAGCSQL
jgi:hypothetical protein